MKTLLVTKTLTKGGAASGARNLLGALQSAGADVIALDGYASLAAHPLKAVRLVERVCEHALADAETHFARLGPPTFDLAQVYAQYRPDIIQLCDVSGNTIRFSDIARVPCPVVHRMSDFWPYHGAHHYAVTLPSVPTLADKLLRRLVFDGRHMPTCRVAPSDWLASRLTGGEVRVIRNAVTLPSVSGDRTVAPTRLRFGFISAQVSDPRKGFDSLPMFLRAVAKRSPTPVELHVYGRAPRAGFSRGDEFEIIHHPPFTKADLARVYGSFDVLLCPSRLDNSPNVVAEALTHGVPTIGQSGTGMESYIREDIGGLVDFHSGTDQDIKQFAEICSRIVANYSDFSAQAVRYAQQELAPEVIGAEYLKLYQDLLGRGRI